MNGWRLVISMDLKEGETAVDAAARGLLLLRGPSIHKDTRVTAMPVAGGQVDERAPSDPLPLEAIARRMAALKEGGGA